MKPLHRDHTDEFSLAWRESWAEPHMQKGLSILRQLTEAREKKLPEGHDPIVFNALQNARREGFQACLSLIRLLSVSPNEAQTPSAPLEWEHR